jgi:hypothetical protein
MSTTANDYTVSIPGLPALLVRAEVYPPEPEVGIWSRQVEIVDAIRGAEHELTPEQETEADDRCGEVMDAVERAYAEARDWS